MVLKVPQHVRETVIARLYDRFDAMLWEQLTSKEKSDAYTHFVADESIGGCLSPFMRPDKIRVWIKDGPAKEYVRALEGVSSYSRYTNRSYPSAQETVKKVMGTGWTLVEGSVEEKPMRCLAQSNTAEDLYVVWGPSRDLKELVWHILLHRSSHPNSETVLVITRPSMAPLPRSDRNQAERLCKLIGTEFRSIERAATAKLN